MKYAIIAAGQGSRLAQEGVSAPKPLVELDGRPMIRRLIDIFISCEAEEIAVIVNEQMAAVAAYLSAIAPELSVPLRLTVRTTPGSMHSLHYVTQLFDGGDKFIATTVDTIFREDDFRRYAQAFADDDANDGMMAVTPYIDDEKPLYIDTDTEGLITAFRDAPWPGVQYISGGIYGLSAKALAVLHECMTTNVNRMRDFQRALLSAGLKLRAYPMGKIIDVDHASDIDTARRFIAQA